MRAPVFLLAVMAVCTSCLDNYTAQRFAFPSIQTGGRYGESLTIDDLRQINRLANARSDIRKPIDQIIADHPNEAEVNCGNPLKQGDPGTTFRVRKKNGQWR